jgi:hypothetical protein
MQSDWIGLSCDDWPDNLSPGLQQFLPVAVEWVGAPSLPVIQNLLKRLKRHEHHPKTLVYFQEIWGSTLHEKADPTLVALHQVEIKWNSLFSRIPYSGKLCYKWAQDQFAPEIAFFC